MADHEWTVTPTEAGLRLDKFLAHQDRLGSRAKAFAAIERGKVFVDEVEAAVSQASRPLASGQVVRVWIDRPGSARRRRPATRIGDLDVIFEDDDLLVVAKPAGLLSVPLERTPDAPSALEQVDDYLRRIGRSKALVVHRIDQDTSGLVVFAKDGRAQAALQAQFKRRTPERIYLAVVLGHPEPAEGVWRDRIAWDDKALIQKASRGETPDSLDAISEYCVRESYRDASVLEIRLVTGRRNQIRIQAQLHGVPLVGDKRYAPDDAAQVQFRRQALHAWRLAFEHPADGRPLEFTAPLPADFQSLLDELARSRRRR